MATNINKKEEKTNKKKVLVVIILPCNRLLLCCYMNKALKKPKKNKENKSNGTFGPLPLCWPPFPNYPVVIVSFHTFTSLTHAHTTRHVFENPYKTFFSFLMLS